MRPLVLVAALLGPLALPACSTPSGASAPDPGATVTGAEAHELVAAGAFLLDVRTAGEFAGGHLDGATNIPVSDLGDHLDQVPNDKTIVVYCASGARSASATRALRAKGYDARDLGPMSAWSR